MSHVLYLVRHAIAAPTSTGGSDYERRLTADGRRKMHQAAAGLKGLGIAPDAVLSSPLRRARETADILVEVLAPDLEVQTYEPLASGGSPHEVLEGLSPYESNGHIFLVGHQPDLGYLASHLLTGAADIAPLPFKKGAVAAIEVHSLPPRAPGTLEWFIAPRQLRAMAGEP